MKDTATMTRFNDLVDLRDAKRLVDVNGFVHVPAIITRVGIQQYTKDQLGIPGVKGSEVVNVFRPPETVFHEDTISSFKHLPVTDGHPPRGVSPKNAKIVQGGHIGEDVSKLDEKNLGSTLHLTDESFIKRSKGSQTSAGYDAKIVQDSGEFEGVPYEYRFDGAMIGNHLALVPRARCGEGCRVLDEHKQEKRMEVHEVQALIDASLTKAKEEITGAVGQTIQDALTAHQQKLDEKAAADKVKADEEAEAKKKADEEAEAKKKADTAATEARIELMTKVKPLVTDEAFASFKELDNQKVLAAVLKDSVQDAESKSEDYLMAVLDQELESRGRAKGRVPKADQGIPAGGVVVKPII